MSIYFNFSSAIRNKSTSITSYPQIGKDSQLWAVDGQCQFLNKLGFTLAVRNKEIYKHNQPLDAWVRVDHDFNCWKMNSVGTSGG